ncbi:hypothetical protein, partial [Calothrix sp. UHCC 0171]|uniref:hypothetical protein n=1 Tax=Calothrix sp. UHCC 0171 TaxID=3110245 RepID=UPI002B1FFB36
THINENLRICQNQILLLREKVNHRDGLSHEKECPTCGSHLDNEEIQIRLAQEYRSWQEEISKLEWHEESINSQLKLKQKEKSTTENTIKEAQIVTRDAELKLASANTKLQTLEATLVKQRQIVDLAQKEAGVWAEMLDELPDLEIEWHNLKTAPEQKQKLSEARILKNSIDQTINSCKKELEKLPIISGEQRQYLKIEVENIVLLVTQFQNEKETIEVEFQKAKSKSEALEKQKREIDSNINLAQNKLSDLQLRQQKAEYEVEQQTKALPQNWSLHPACINQEELEKLQEELANLNKSETEENQLREAQNRVNQLAGAINTLKDQLEKIPEEHRRSVDEFQAELDVINTELQQTEEKLNVERQKLTEMKNQRQKYEEQQEKLNEAKKELSYYERLVDAFGNKGLQAKIIQKAQEAIKVNANNTLAHLSNGTWQIDLKENAEQTELDILARDLSQPNTPLRQFEYLSSGEKFLVAVSLAVAIGQSIYGGRTVDTLVIDEGFGNLDKVKRPLMVSELSRLSQDVLRGGRVIVVSHQEDVCEEFGSKYRIYRDANNHAKIEFSTL